MREESLYYLLECTSEYYISYKQIRNFIKNNKLKDEIVFRDIYVEGIKFILLSSKGNMKRLQNLCSKTQLPASQLIKDSVTKSTFILPYDDVSVEFSAKINEENKTITLSTGESEYIFKVIFKN